MSSLPSFEWLGLALNETKVFQREHKSLRLWLMFRSDAYLHFLLGLLQLKKDELILDGGCGNGRFSIALAQRGSNAVALDVNLLLLKEAGNKARKNALGQKIELVLADIQRLPFRSGIFDKVLCVHNLWYVPDYKLAVREMLRTHVENGEILVDHLNLLNWHVFLGWIWYVGARILRRNSTPLFYRTPHDILKPFSAFHVSVFSLVVKQRSHLYATEGVNPFCARLIIRCSKKPASMKHPKHVRLQNI